ncbi:MAG: SDR family NAD(P)-dependent oxidoreductase, partial [Planctomycetota bacterium]
MEQQLTGKVAIVTGSAQGIGKAVAMRLANEGAELIVADINKEKAEQTAREIRAFDQRAMACPINLANVE